MAGSQANSQGAADRHQLYTFLRPDNSVCCPYTEGMSEYGYEKVRTGKDARCLAGVHSWDI